jgi:hypothetical protein
VHYWDSIIKKRKATASTARLSMLFADANLLKWAWPLSPKTGIFAVD